MTEQTPSAAWNTWEVVPSNQLLTHNSRYAAILNGAGKVAPRRAIADSWDQLVDRLREVDPARITYAVLFVPDRIALERDPLRWPAKVPADVRSIAELNRALDHLVHLHRTSNHHGDHNSRAGRWCNVCLDEPHPCFTVREVQAARRLAWRDRGTAGEWEPMTAEELVLSAASYAKDRRFWVDGIGDLPALHYNAEQVERRKRPTGWNVTPAPRTHTPREEDVEVSPESGAGDAALAGRAAPRVPAGTDRRAAPHRRDSTAPAVDRGMPP